jgi:hypothetical protein
MFVNDAEQGFAFIDVCRHRYDVALMNPPFGAFPDVPRIDTIQGEYIAGKNYIYSAFVQRGLGLLQDNSALGAITSRTWLALSSFRKWREHLLTHARPTLISDLGRNVLDGANVQVCMYSLQRLTE